MIEAIAGVNAAAAATGSVQLSPAAGAAAPETQGVSFAEAIKGVMTENVQTIQGSEQMSMKAMHGTASLQEVVQATMKAEVAVETTISVRNKLIESYQEIMRMPI
ncbi:MAG: flagellar hook-basal body complex protein FliE [Parvularcula sp.]|jgi:flagellar hook-basal body complex protein FliE|nr:flagellar hook-basal body complex protein FliE [Parvularcula sp.]